MRRVLQLFLGVAIVIIRLVCRLMGQRPVHIAEQERYLWFHPLIPLQVKVMLNVMRL